MICSMISSKATFVWSPVIQRAKFRQGLAGGPYGEIRPEEKLIRDLVFKRDHKPVIELPFAMKSSGQIGKDLRVLAQENDAFLHPGLPEMCNDHLHVRLGAGDPIEEGRIAIFMHGIAHSGGLVPQDRHFLSRLQTS
jgi:hypothetical protein